MSATVETNTASWRKRARDEDRAQMEVKRPRIYYRLESESSRASEEETESVYSLQDRETDVVRDTSDTDSRSSDHNEYEVHYEEYDVASLSESDNGFDHFNTSSGTEEDMMLAAAAAVICDSSLETWITDCEESDNSSIDDASFGKTDFSTCVQCKSENDNPLYRYCEKCFQSCRQCKMRKTYKCFPLCISCHKDRKKFFPPRPKGNKKSRTSKKKNSDPPVKLATLRSCLNGLAQDSGLGSSQECPPLELDRIVVPDHHLRQEGTSKISTKIGEKETKVEEGANLADGKSSERKTGGCESICSKDTAESSGSFSSVEMILDVKGRKRQLSESSLSDIDTNVDVKRRKTNKNQEISDRLESVSRTSDLGSEISGSSGSIVSTSVAEAIKTSENSELCILCNDAPKDGIFLHTNVAHQCCCYRCAKRTLKTVKRCPICNLTINKVYRLIKS